MRPARPLVQAQISCAMKDFVRFALSLVALALLIAFGAEQQPNVTSGLGTGPSWTVSGAISFETSEVLTISGLRTRRAESSIELPRASYLPAPHPGYERPERPEDILVTLTTSDGKRWRAKWEAIP